MNKVYAVAENRLMNDGTLISSLDLFFFNTEEEANEICEIMSSHEDKPQSIVYTVIECKIRTVEDVKKRLIYQTFHIPEVDENNWYCPN